MTPTDRVRAALDQLINYAQDSNGNQYGSLCASLVEHIAQQALSELDGMVLVPVGPTREMLNAAVDVDTFRLGDISPLGFRISPQRLFEKCYAAMIAPYVEGE